MDRRSLFGAAVGAAASLVAAPREASAGEFDPTVAARDKNGNAICRIYREVRDDRTGRREFREIRPGDVRAGDRIVCVGQDGPRLWMCREAEVAEMVPPGDDGIPGFVPVAGTFTDILAGGRE